jgi:hypothetical protein
VGKSTIDPDAIRELAADPEALAQRISAAYEIIGDDAPGIRMIGEERAHKMIQALAMRAPRSRDSGILPMQKTPMTDRETQEWADINDAVFDAPGAIARRLASGTLTPKFMEAVQATSPAIVREFRTAMVLQLQSLKRTLSPDEKAQLEIALGVPLDESSSPQYRAWLAGNERMMAGQAQERVQNAGNRAPPAKPKVDARSFSQQNQTRGMTPREGVGR